jgi:hypothetical protein
MCRINRRVSPPAPAEGGTQPTQVGLDVSRGFAQPRIIRLKASQSARTIGLRDLSVNHAPTPLPYTPSTPMLTTARSSLV